MVAPTVNSYRRLIPGFWAPTDATWGVENRTCALRVIPGQRRSRNASSTASRRPTANPYIILAAALASGSVRHRAPDRARAAGDRQRLRPQVSRRGSRCRARCGMRRSGSRARRWRATGSATHFVEHFAATREWEEREFRKHITRLGARAVFRDHLTESGRGIRAPPRFRRAVRVTCPLLSAQLGGAQRPTLVLVQFAELG